MECSGAVTSCGADKRARGGMGFLPSRVMLRPLGIPLGSVRPLRRSSSMRRVLTLAVVTLAFVACKKPEAPPRPAPSAAAQGQAQGQPPAPGKDQILRGKVLEKIDVSQYSYLKLATASGAVWAAVQRTDKKVGDEVGVGNAFPMQGFESKELNRKFDVVYFGQLAGAGGEVAAMPPAMGGGMGGGTPAMGGEAGGPPNPAQMAAQHQAVATGPAD